MHPFERVIARYGHTPRTIDDETEHLIDREVAPWPGTMAGCGLVLAIPIVAAIAGACWAVGYWRLGLLALPLLVLLPIAAVLHGASVSRARKKRAIRAATEAPLIVGHVVQANHSLYEEEDAMAPALLAYCTEPSRALDLAFGKWVASGVQALKGRADPGGALSPLWRRVNAEGGYGRVQVPPSVAGNEQTFIQGFVIVGKELPGGSLTASGGLVPLVLIDGRVELLPAALVRAAVEPSAQLPPSSASAIPTHSSA